MDQADHGWHRDDDDGAVRLKQDEGVRAAARIPSVCAAGLP